MRVNFIAENRKSLPSTATKVEIVGSYEPEEVLVVEKWREATEVTVKFYAPISWARRFLLQNSAPKTKGLYVAKYLSFKNMNDEMDYYIIDAVKTEDNGKNNNSMITVVAHSWIKMLEKMPNLVGSRVKARQEANGGNINVSDFFDIIAAFYGPNSAYSFLKIPVESLDKQYPESTPAQYFTDWGYMRPNDRVDGEVEIEDFNVGTPMELIAELYEKYPEYELTTINLGLENNVAAKWAIRRRSSTDIVFSEEKGDLILEGFSLDGENEVFAYDPQRGMWAFTGGDSPLIGDLSGVWLDSRSIEVEVPEDIIYPRKYLKNAARKEKNKDQNISVLGRIFMGRNRAALKTGVKVGLRIGDDVVYQHISEISTSFGKDTGWKKEGIFEISTNEMLTVTEDARKIYYPNDEDGDFGVVSMGDGFFIPFTNSENDGEPPTKYDWKIYWNGSLYGRYSGETNNLRNQGIWIPPEEFVPGVVNRLTITPGDGVYRTGWMRAYSFRRIDDKYKTITDIHQVSDHRKFMLTDEDTGPNFLREQYAGCALIGSRAGEETTFGTIVPETEYINGTYPAATKTIRNGAEYRRFYGCVSSNFHLHERFPAGLESIGSSYAKERFSNCKSVTVEESVTYTPRLETVGAEFKAYEFYHSRYAGDMGEIKIARWGTPHARSIGNDYRSGQFKDCQHVGSVVPEVGSDRVENIGGNFQWQMFSGSSITEHSGVEAEFPNCETIGTYWRHSMYSGCTSLIAAPDERMPAKITKTGDSYRRNVFSGCTSLSETVAEDVAATLTETGTWFRLLEYANCAGLKLAKDEAALPATTVGRGYRELRFLGCTGLSNTAKEAPHIDGVTLNSNYRRGEYSDALNENTIVYPEGYIPRTARVYASYRREQFLNSGATQWQKENTDVGVLSDTVSTYFRAAQYAGSKVSIPDGAKKSDPVLKTRNSVVSSEISRYRENQFQNCVNVIRTLREFQTGTVETNYRWSNYEQGMYSGCVNLETMHPEFKLTTGTIIGSGAINQANYMANKFEGCVSLSPAAAVSNPEGSNVDYSRSTNFRSNMFLNSALDAGNPAQYLDGSSVVAGENNMPLNIYG